MVKGNESSRRCLRSMLNHKLVLFSMTGRNVWGGGGKKQQHQSGTSFVTCVCCPHSVPAEDRSHSAHMSGGPGSV